MIIGVLKAVILAIACAVILVTALCKGDPWR